MEAISEDSFANSAVESMTLFRIEGLDRSDQSVLITPTVSSHYLFIPCQTINGYTVGLAYLDILYERDSYGIKDNRVPPLRLGRFVIDDATGEMFCTAWMDNLMVVAWTQSIIKCERVREFLLFEAPKDGTPPRSLLLRNSFFERRSCALCGLGRSISTLPPPCSGIDNRRLSQDPASSAFNNNSSSSSHSSSQRQVSRKLTNIAAIYRRFRGSYFGVVLKTRYGTDRQPQSQQLVPVFAELKHGLHTVKVGFKNNLRKNIDFVLGGASNDGYFGMNPRSAAKSLLLLRASNPVEAYPSTTSAAAITDAEASSHHHHDRLSRAGSVVPSSDDGDSSVHTGSFSSHYQRMSRASSPSMSEMWSTTLSSVTSKQPQEQGVKDVNAPKRRRSEDPLERDSVMHKRKVRNRISAQRSNKQRKLALDQKKADLERLKLLQPVLEKRLSELRKENEELRVKVYGNSNVGNNNDGSGDDNNNSNSRLLAMMSMTQVQAQQGNTVGNELLFQEQYQDGQQLQQQGMDIVHLGEQQQQQQLDDNGMNVDVIAKVGEQHQQILQQQQLLQLQQQQQQGDGGGGGNDNENVVAGGWTDEDAKMENVVNITDPCLFVR